VPLFRKTSNNKISTSMGFTAVTVTVECYSKPKKIGHFKITDLLRSRIQQ